MGYILNKRNSPNKMSRQDWKPDMIVSHITEGSYVGAISWLSNPQSGASSHFVVSKKGEITQLVDIRESAWVNGTSIKEGTKNHYNKSSLALVRGRKTNANYYTIGIEHEGYSKDGQGKLTEAQFKATVWLHKFIIGEVKNIYGIDIPINRDHVVGHYQIDPIRKPNCPGINFQWNELINELKGDSKRMNTTTTRQPQNDQPSPWAKEAWEWTIEEKLFDGTDPQGNITREQVATVFYRYHRRFNFKGDEKL